MRAMGKALARLRQMDSLVCEVAGHSLKFCQSASQRVFGLAK